MSATRWQAWLDLRGNKGKKSNVHTSNVSKPAGQISTTYAITLATRRTLGSRQAAVSLLSLFTRGSDQTDQTRVTLWTEASTQSH